MLRPGIESIDLVRVDDQLIAVFDDALGDLFPGVLLLRKSIAVHVNRKTRRRRQL